ncbi:MULTISPECIES: aminodeoxychorismate synthase component I [unclassified Rhodococcus (in: high G+C Gram-positive bacteria)]|nr:MULTISPECIES: aminodeoxychorismate synthase component I [unclassified Rhodococcus (in: high G+C Gram-positive bacteria)]MBF0663008.1 aminodeoxychorismate synthase component I [Rhodococcus sp. (in: high G+C Gram-positive bacteria)]NME80084.1 aminodeoxychorismate synthase component I [Rhodococcus sp. 105337]
MRMERLGRGGTPAQVLASLAERARNLGVPPPAAVTGDWFGSAALIAPSLATGAVDPSDAFACPDIREARTPGGPVVGGGWIGYLAYPDGSASGPSPEHSGLPAAAGGWTDTVLRLDADGCWWYETLGAAPCPSDLAAAVVEPRVRERFWHIDWSPPHRETHRRGVEQCLDAIRAGEVYQACVCTRFTGTWTGDPLAFFTAAVARTAPARAAYLQGPWGAVASLSPELFVSRHGDALRSSPIKGTLPLSADPALLRASVKDVAENIMIVDLVRNDLGRVAETGSVTVEELLAVRPAPGVWHLVSTVAARSRPGVTTADLLDAAFPPASVTGCPKIRARDLLRQWEPHSRGVYCGTVGMSSPLAGTELNVAIRTVEFGAGTCVLGVGGGITIDSDPDAEWQECLDKAASILALSTPRERVRADRTAAGCR